MASAVRMFLTVVLLGGLPVAVSGQTAGAEKELQAIVEKAMALAEQGKYEQALPYYQKALQMAPAVLGKDDLNTALIQNNLAIVYYSLGQYDQAETLYRRSLAIKEANLGKYHPDVALTLSNLSTVYTAIGRYPEAESTLRRCLEIRTAKLGKDSTEVSVTLHNLANLYHAMGQDAKAEPLYRRSLEIKEANLGKDHPYVALTLNCIANLYTNEEKYAQAEPLYRRSLEIQKAKLGEEHPEVAMTLSNLAILYHTRGQYAQAEPLYRRSLEITEKNASTDSPETARILNGLGFLYKDMGRYDQADTLLQRSLKARAKQVGEDHPDVAWVFNNLVWLNAAFDKWNEAAAWKDRERHATARYVSRVLPFLAPREQLDFLTAADSSAQALSLGLARRDDPATRLRTAAWLLNFKGVAQRSLTERTLLERDATEPGRRTLVQQLSALRQQQAALALAAPKAGQEADRLRRLQEMAERQQGLERQLVQAGGTPPPREWIELDQVRAALPADAVFIDIACFKVANFKAKVGEKLHAAERYAAWLVPAKDQGDVQLVDLGEAEPIDQAIAALRQELQLCQGSEKEANPLLRLGEADAEKRLRPVLAALAKLVLEPLRKHLDGKAQWILCPDAALWLVPWAALPLDETTYALEKHTIRYVVSGRNVLTPAFQGKLKRDPSVIMADPDFDIDPQEAAGLTGKLLGKQPALNDAIASNSPLGVRSASALGRVSRLPGTAAEATAIKPKLQAYVGEEPWVYRGKNALEGVFKAFHSPKVVVLSTHGFFLGDQEFKNKDRAGLDSNQSSVTKDGKLPENPLLRCGLLLAGCNQAAAAKPGQEDGVLTGLEIVGIDLRGTDLVVLSACETGLGQVRNGEGVAGLRQAFQLAGAQTVVASLWQVSDRDTALLMSDFFDGLARGKSKAGALRDAQLARIKAHRDRDGAAHPFLWAAFTITGK